MRNHLSIVRTAGISAMELADGVAHYLQRGRNRGLAANSIAAYRNDLGHFTAFVTRLGQGTLVALLGAHHVDRFFDDQAAQGIGNRSQARRLSVLRAFFKHARREGWIGHDPTADVQIRFRTARVVAPELDQLHGLIDAIPRTGTLNLRDRAMLRLALDTGMRIGELAGLDLHGLGSQSEIDLQRGLAHVQAKGGEIHTMCFNDTTRRAVEAWLAVRDSIATPGCGALFVSQKGGRFSRQGLHLMLKKRGAAAGLPEIHFHLLRHRRGAMVIETCGAKVGQQFLGHSSLESTSHYGRHANNATFALLRQRADIDEGRARA